MRSQRPSALPWHWSRFAGIREQLALVNIPKGMRGMPIVLITASLLALAFMGFSGLQTGLGTLFGVN